MSKYGVGLLRSARLTRRQLIAFALVSAVINGIVTATIGAWLAQTYTTQQNQRKVVESISHLVYERRTRAGMVASALRRNAELDEVRYRKRAYDESYVDWNKNVLLNLVAIREVMGEVALPKLEGEFQDQLVAAMSDVDRCLTKAYDARIGGQDPLPLLDACRMSGLHQFVLDCAATFTNELHKVTPLSFVPFYSGLTKVRELAEQRIQRACVRPAELIEITNTPPPSTTPAPPAPPEPIATSTAPAAGQSTGTIPVNTTPGAPTKN